MNFRLFGVTAAVLCLVGCGPKSPDYQSIWTTSATTTTTAPTTTGTGKPVAFPQYLESIGVSGEQVAPDSLTDLTVSIPTPPGWSTSTNWHFSPGTVAISKGPSYPMAILMVFKLSGDFDAAEVVKHSFADAELTQNFKKLDSSTDDYHGFPSGMIQGSYDQLGQRLHSYNRVVIPTGAAPAKQRYLVQLTITTIATQAVAESDDVEAIIHGFTVAAK
ncbi:LpqN/LpqT family lipoprotein [Mycobacterium sp. pUA109]|uniref:LpqN/LpqT family lipoprotein n=1 Tax=Mycobacterium sp. pUA109 TaxID=3238982 RepID=UPI00351BA807